MSDRPNETWAPEEERVRSTLASLEAAPAEPSFRERLKREFVSGEIAASRPRIVPGGAKARRWRPELWIGVPAAAAAAVVAVALLNRGPAWSVTSTSGQGVAVIGNVPVPMNHREDLARSIKPGVRVRIPDGASLEIMSPGQLAIEVTSGTEMVLPRTPGRWFGRRVATEMKQGELRITTGAEFQGAHLAIATPEARVDVTGTTLAVIREPHGTCVCVLEGRVMVGAKEGAMAAVEAGTLRFTFGDGSEPKIASIREIESVKLREFRDQKRALMK
jgi:hypothetical protein